VVYNVSNGRIGYARRSNASKSAWIDILLLRGLLLYPSIAVLTYWSIETNGSLIFEKVKGRMKRRKYSVPMKNVEDVERHQREGRFCWLDLTQQGLSHLQEAPSEAWRANVRAAIY
jgi:hypothetical protein